MKYLLFLSVLLLFSSCNDPKKLTAPFKSLKGTDETGFVTALSREINYYENTYSITIFTYPDSYTWIPMVDGRPVFNEDDPYSLKDSKVVANLLRLDFLHDEIDKECYLADDKLTVLGESEEYDENECDDYELNEDGTAPDDIPEVCLEYLNLDKRLGELNEEKTSTIAQIQGLVDADIEEPSNWKISLEDKRFSTIVFSDDKKRIEKLEISFFGKDRLTYSIENGGISHVEIDFDARKMSFIMNLKNSDKTFSGKRYLFQFGIKAQVSLKGRLRFIGKFYLLDHDFRRIIQRDVGSAKIEFVKAEY